MRNTIIGVWPAALLAVLPAQVFCAETHFVPQRVNNRSPAFRVNEEDVDFFMNYSAYVPGPAGSTKPPDLVGKLTDAIVARKRAHPEVRVAIILDPSHKAYGKRVSPAEKRLRENGVDVFYSDLISDLKRASLLGVREGLGHAGLGSRFAHWHDGADRDYRRRFFEECFPLLGAGTAERDGRDVTVTFVTEAEIVRSILEMLQSVTPDDAIRIQMFYLSCKPVLEAILEASRTTRHPVRLLLDPSKDAFNRRKDGTPNRQVARYLLDEAAKRGGRIAIRWYLTRGEQNHAKVMSITNAKENRFIITTGSCNWTGRNMAGVNMEANVNLEGSRKVTQAFNRLFDLFWTQSDGRLYSEPYENYRDAVAPDWKWHLGEAPYFYSAF